MLKKDKFPTPPKGRPILVEFELPDDRRVARFARVNRLKRATAVRLLTLRALAFAESAQKEGAA